MIKLYLYFLLFIFFSTEVLSYFHLLTRPWVVGLDILFLFIAIRFLGRDKIKLSWPSDWTSYIIALLLILTFFQGLFSAPSTTDAMTYVINRIMYWIQDQTVWQNFIRSSHDFMPPFASYILLHLYFIFNGDRFLFLSQWLAYAGSIFLSGTIASQLGGTKKVKNYTMIFVATIPIAVLQATSTQTDMLSAFITLLAIHLALVLHKNPSYKNALILGLALGLGMLIKATFYIFAIIPLSLLFILLVKKPKKAISIGALILVIALVMNLRYFWQNTNLYGNPLGQKLQGKGNTYVNERFDPPAIVSNLVKNTMNNIPVPLFSAQVQSALIGFHQAMGLDIADPRVSYSGLDFKVHPVIYPQEDLAASPLHILLIIFAGFFIFRKNFKHKKRNELRILYSFLALAYVVFAFILKYESVHNRLLLTFLVVGTIISVVVLKSYRVTRLLANLFLFLSVPLAFLLILLNVHRPYISYNLFYNKVKNFAASYQILPEAFYQKPRTKQYFNSRPYWYEPYDKVTDLIAKEGKNQIITMELMDDEFEYPLWAMLKEKKVNFYVHQNKFIKKNILPSSFLLTTSEKPIVRNGFQTKCFKTKINYGYACLSKIGAF